MSAPWLKRLQKMLHEQDWVKGAVNYDEDLHFSSYYLRASSSAVTIPLYPGYSCILASYDGTNETYYLLKRECHESAAAIVARAVREPQWLAGVLRQIERRSDALAGIFPPETSPVRLARLPDARLLALYRRHDARNRALYKYARLPEALDRGVSYFTGYLMDHLESLGLAPSDRAEAFAVISQPVVPSVLAQEILEFDDIVESARADGMAIPSATDNPARARMFLDAALVSRLAAHHQKWQFLPYHGYGRRELATLDRYVERLVAQIRNPAALTDSAGLLDRCRQAERAREELLQRLHVDPPHRALFELYPQIGAVKLYRRHAQLRNFYYLDMLLAEIARRLGVSEWTIRCMLPEEVVASLRSGGPIGTAIGERQGGCVYALVGDEEHIVVGAQAQTLRDQAHPRPHAGGAPNVLHGVVASRGKVAGRCRVIIRADDYRATFEKGTILVSESTDPDLVRFLRAAGGVLTEQGGVTSHAAIICRELNVPTIIGIDGLLERVHDGDWVEMDAERGIVTVVEPRPGLANGVPALPSSPQVIGAKAFNLGAVRALGFQVPDYVLVGAAEARRVAGGVDRPASHRLVERVLAQLGPAAAADTLALRSSAVAEDGADGSQAGEYRSLLTVGPQQLALALRDFVQANMARRNGASYRGSVIVQRMIHATCAGVCLTRDERTRHGDAVIIEMTAGGNTGVTGGTVRPDRIVVDRRTGDILDDERRCAKLLRQKIDVAWMVHQLLTLEARFGKPLDIEWALAGRELYILQARPIVTGSGPGRRPAPTR